MTATRSSRIRVRASGLSTRKVGGELVILDLDRSRYLTISGSGVFLFDLLQKEHDREELISALLSRFEVGEDAARRDVEAFLIELSDADLLATD